MNTFFRRILAPVLLAVATLSATTSALLAAVPTSISITSPSSGLINGTGLLESPNNTVTIMATAAPSGSGSITQVDFRVNGTSIGVDTTAPYQFDWTPTAPGTYSLTAIATDSTAAPNTLTSSSVTVNVSAVHTVTLLAPAANSVLTNGSDIFLRASAAMSDGVVDKVEFFLDPSGANTKIGEATTTPYSALYTVAAAVGSHTVIARVTPSNGTGFETAPTTFSVTTGVGTKPAVAITSPANSATIATGAAITITATASDSDPGGFIPSTAGGGVTFYADGEPIGTDLTAPYTVSWTPTVVKTYSLYAQAVDDKGNTTISSAVQVNSAVVNSTTTVSLTSPANGDAIGLGTSATLVASPVPANGTTINRVDFLVGTTVIGTRLTAPYSVNWTPTATGVFSLTARVTDSANTTVTSSAVNVSVTGPGIALTEPAFPTTMTTNQNLVLVAIPSAVAPATVTKVDFFSGNTLIGTALNSPYVANWMPTTAGTSTVTARVTDSNGATATSTGVSVTVTASAVPTVSLTAPAAGTTVSLGAAVSLTANAAATGGATVSRVEFLVDGNVVATDTTPPQPFTGTWTPTTAGTASISARVTDSNGISVTTTPITVTVGDPSIPTLSLNVTPSTTTTLPMGASRYIVANAAGVNGRAIETVEFILNGGAPVVVRNAPYTYRFSAPRTLGQHTLLVRATDNGGLIREQTLTFTVVNAVGNSPTVSLIAPTPNTTVLPGTLVNFAALASDTDGTIASVQFYANGEPQGAADTTSPFSGSFTPTTPGTYVLEAIATDDKGNTTTSAAVNLITAFASPTIAITSPSPATTARATPNVPLNITATAVGGGGSGVLLVEFLVDGNVLGTRSAPTTGTSYTFQWTPTTADLGAHQITARVTDNNSRTATSTTLNVNVANITGTAPTVNVNVQPAQNVNAPIQTLSTINFIANATFATINSPQNSVEFFLNDVNVGRATAMSQTAFRLAFDFSRYDFSALIPDPTSGRYTLPLYAIARDGNGNQTVSATTQLSIASSASLTPSVSLTPLLIVTPITAGSLVAYGATISDPDGTIASVVLYSNGTQVAVANNPQFNPVLTFTPTVAGTFSIYAIVTDDTGNTSISAPLTLTVAGNSAPSVALIRPTADQTVTQGSPVFLEAQASDTDAGQTVSVTFVNTTNPNIPLAFGTRVGTSDIFRAIWVPNAGQVSTTPITVAARATDTAGGAVNSLVTRRVTVTNVIGIAPVVTISVPTSTTTASTVSLTATATDSDGSVVGVEFFVNRNSVGEATRFGLTNTWRLTTSFAGLTPGNVEVVALARDSSGNTSASPTSTITVNAAQSIAPTITISATPNNVAFSRQVQLTANARDNEGNVASVQYFANGVSVGTSTNNGTNFQVNWTPNASGTFNVFAVATDGTVNGQQNTTVSAAIPVTVRRNNPVIEDSAFILQSYSDIANTTNINAIILQQLDEDLAAGRITRAQFLASLTTEAGFVAPVNFLAAYYTIMGTWPTPQIYNNLIGTARGSIANAVNSVIGSAEYIAKYPERVTPTAALLNNPNSVIPARTFLQRLWANAGRSGAVSDLDLVQFMNNDTANVSLGIARGYNSAGLTTAIAEFVTIKNASNTALFNKARAAALYYQVDRPPQPTGMTAEQIGAQIAIRVNALAALPDIEAMADAVLKDILYTYRYVTITKHPASLTVAPRSGAIFSVEAIGQPPLSYQWLLNGAPVPGGTNSVLSLTNVDGSRVGTYTVNVTSSANSSTSDPATLSLSSTPTRLANISTRGVTSGGANVLTGGFVVTGTAQTQTRQMLIRVVGPTLGAAPFSVQGFLPNPRLELYAGNNPTPVATNDDWNNQGTGGAAAVTALVQATARAGAFTLPNGSLDAAILVTLPPGSYSVQAKGQVANASGVVLIEAYDVTQGTAVGPKAINVSTRGEVGTGNNILIAGFVVNGAVSRRVLIRGVGPTLTAFGLPAGTLLANPEIILSELGGSNRVIKTNDDWHTGEDAAVIASAASAGGAFALANGGRDAAMIVMLPPGGYTVQLRGVNNTTGIGIVEVYDVDP